MSLGISTRYEIAGGTVTGRSHALSGKPNQDAHAWVQRGEILVAAVCDGCGSGARSEVGAELGARITVARLADRLERGAALDAPALWDGLRDDLLDALGALSTAMGGSLARTVSDCFLFTVIGLALVGEHGAVFAAGDGIFAVDGAVTTLGPFPGNEPPYLGYGLLDRRAPGLMVARTFTGAETVLLGTDGAADLEALSVFWEDDRHFENRDAVRRRLTLASREPRRLDDDTTVVVIRRAR